MLAATIHLLRGTPYIYMGEELGMIDPTYTTINDYVDIEALNAYESLLAQGHSEKEAFAIVLAKRNCLRLIICRCCHLDNVQRQRLVYHLLAAI